MVAREKTRLELVEELSKGPNGSADRLREALFVVTQLEDLGEVKKVAWAALKGELHGHERARQSSAHDVVPPLLEVGDWHGEFKVR